MKKDIGVWTLCRALLWRVWLEQRKSIFVVPAAFCGLLLLVVACAYYAPGLLTGPTRAALEHGAESQLGLQHVRGGAALSISFLQLQAPLLLALFAGLSAASIAQRTIGSEAERGSLEILLASRYRISEIGVAMLFSSYAMAATSWIVLVVAAAGTGRLLSAWFGFPLSLDGEMVAAAIAMQLVLALLAAEIATMITLLFPRLARLRGGVSADPLQLLAALPALAVFAIANVWPQIGFVMLSLGGLAAGMIGLVIGTALVQLWFRPTAFLES